MAKRKTRVSASEPAAVPGKPVVVLTPVQTTEEKVVTPPPPTPTPTPPAPMPTVITDTCGSCGVEKTICYYASDLNWERPGHPDHFERPICRDCVVPEFRRGDCCVAVYDAMRKKLTNSGISGYEVEEAVHVAWRTFNVDYDNDALTKLAKQLKVKSEWLKRK